MADNDEFLVEGDNPSISMDSVEFGPICSIDTLDVAFKLPDNFHSMTEAEKEKIACEFEKHKSTEHERRLSNTDPSRVIDPNSEEGRKIVAKSKQRRNRSKEIEDEAMTTKYEWNAEQGYIVNDEDTSIGELRSMNGGMPI